MIRQTAAGVEIDIRVIPRARRTGVAGTRDGRLLVRLAAPPVGGAANEALVELLSTSLGCPRRDVLVVSGENSRTKRILIERSTLDAVKARLLIRGVVG